MMRAWHSSMPWQRKCWNKTDLVRIKIKGRFPANVNNFALAQELPFNILNYAISDIKKSEAFASLTII